MEFEVSGTIPPFYGWVKGSILEGRPVTYDRHEYLRQPYRDDHPHQVEMKAAELGLTSKAMLRVMYGARYLDWRGILYLFPLKSDVTDFSKGRIDPLIDENPETVGRWVKDTDAANINRIWNCFTAGGIRDDRPYQKELASPEGGTSQGKPATPQPVVEEVAPEGEGGRGPVDVVLPATGTVEPGEREPGEQPTGPAGKPRKSTGARTGGRHEVPGGRGAPIERPVTGGEERPGESSPGGPGATTQPPERGPAGLSEAEGLAGELQIAAQKKESQGEITDNLYEGYSPERLKIAGAKLHPSPLVQSVTMGKYSGGLKR